MIAYLLGLILIILSVFVPLCWTNAGAERALSKKPTVQPSVQPSVVQATLPLAPTAAPIVRPPKTKKVRFSPRRKERTINAEGVISDKIGQT